jgi:hypothetical protein
MRNKSLTILSIVLVSAFVGLIVSPGFAAEDVIRISKSKLEKLIGNPNVIILDVRYSQHWQNSEYKIKGAIRRRPTLFDSWANEFPRDKLLVLY